MSSSTRPLNASSREVFRIEHRYDPKCESARLGSVGAPRTLNGSMPAAWTISSGNETSVVTSPVASAARATTFM